MNERIKQLCEYSKAYANECTKHFTGDETVFWMDYYTERFSQLIVQECAMIGDAMLCTHLQDVSLLRLDAASSRIVSLNSVLPKGNYKLAACKSQGVFFVADPCHVMAIDPNGNVLSKKRIIEQNGRIVQKVQSLACDELSNKVSVIQTDDLNYEMVSLLEWTGAAFNVIGGLNMDEVDYDAQVIIDPLRHPLNIMNEYQSPSPSTVQLLSPLHFTAWVSDESEDEVCKLFKIDEPDMKKKGRQTRNKPY